MIKVRIKPVLRRKTTNRSGHKLHQCSFQTHEIFE